MLGTESSGRPPPSTRSPLPGRARGELEMRDVGFAYPGAEQPVLRDVELHRPRRADDGDHRQHRLRQDHPGEPDAAALRRHRRLGAVDGVDVRELDPDLLWGHIGLVPQKPYLFSGTVASNLRYGKPDATEEELWQALGIAQAEDFVEEMEGGLDAPISQGGTNVSGGQRQRLAIARALVKRPEIYIFDDSFSALDTATDARLRQALRQHTAGATLVIVAQRVSTHHGRGPDPGARRRRDRRRAEPTTNCWRLSETYPEIVKSQLTAEEAA